jgi:endonuclease YncB( thermonuclease family)
MRRIWRVLLLLLLAAASPALAKEAFRPGGEALVNAVVDGDTVVLESAVMGANQVRLVGIQAPKLLLGRKNFPTWPLAAESKRLWRTWPSAKR